jgi:hypothetical protein
MVLCLHSVDLFVSDRKTKKIRKKNAQDIKYKYTEVKKWIGNERVGNQKSSLVIIKKRRKKGRNAEEPEKGGRKFLLKELDNMEAVSNI